MSKERAVRRAERERAAAETAAARAAEAERARRRTARRQSVMRWLPARVAGPSGIIAERRRTRVRLIVAVVLLVNVVVWLLATTWSARIGSAVVSLLLLPVLLLLAT